MRRSAFRLGEAGVVTIEFAVLLPLLLLLFFGALEVVRLQIASTLVERVLYDLAFHTRVSKGNVELNALLKKIAEKKLVPMVSVDDLTVSATSGQSVLLLNNNPASGTGEGGDVVRLELKARIGFLSWLRPETFQAERTFVTYFVNEADEYWSIDDD